jgi:hypothetical protein
MRDYLDDLTDEILDEIVYEYEDAEDIDVDEIIANLKSNISDYLYDNPEDNVPEEPETYVDYGYKDDFDMSIELIEKLEPKKDICG